MCFTFVGKPAAGAILQRALTFALSFPASYGGSKVITSARGVGSRHLSADLA